MTNERHKITSIPIPRVRHGNVEKHQCLCGFAVGLRKIVTTVSDLGRDSINEIVG